MTSFGQRLKIEREKKQLSKVALGKIIGLHYSQIGRYERDEASPSADMLNKLANELNNTTDFLMNGTSNEMAEEKIKDKTLINQFNKIANLNEENKNIVISLIDAFVFKQEMKNRLTQ